MATTDRGTGEAFVPEPAADLAEVFAGVQGEGPAAGTPQVFVRFAGCPHRCAYCDTPEALVAPPVCAVREGGERDRTGVRLHPNPRPMTWIAREAVRLAALADPPVGWVSLTGGEPLAQPAACVALARRLREEGMRIHLETAGTLPAAMRAMRGLVDRVSMDLKFPSATGEGACWDLHRAFLEAAQGAPSLVVKAVVAAGTPDGEWEEAIRVLQAAPGAEVAVQPVTPEPGGPASPSGAQLDAWLLRLGRAGRRGALSRQTHRVLGAAAPRSSGLAVLEVA